MRAWTKLAITGIVASVGVSGGACLSSPDDPIDPALADVVLQGEATHGALAEVAYEEPIPNVAVGPLITHPPNNSVLTAGVVVTFEWQHRPTASRDVPVDVRQALSFGAPRSSTPALPAWLSDLVGPERSAHAAPRETMSGVGYYLVFTTLTGARLLRVFTTETSYTPDQKAWETLASAGIWTELRVSSAAFFDDAMLGYGPFEGEHIEFCIERE